MDPQGNIPSNTIRLGNTAIDSYSRGRTLPVTNGGVVGAIRGIVQDRITAGSFPSDPNAIYVVFTAPDVTLDSGFGTTYCGWHINQPITKRGGGTFDAKLVLIPNPTNVGACISTLFNPGPNSLSGDSMASGLAHELHESVTDPDLNAWTNPGSSGENGDICQGTYGTTFAAGGGRANITLGGMNFLLQQLYVNTGAGSCAMGF
jgi:hypothetical protein